MFKKCTIGWYATRAGINARNAFGMQATQLRGKQLSNYKANFLAITNANKKQPRGC